MGEGPWTGGGGGSQAHGEAQGVPSPGLAPPRALCCALPASPPELVGCPRHLVAPGRSAPPCPHGLHPPLSTHAPSRHPSGFSGLLTPPLSPGRTNPEGPTSPWSGALRRPRPRAPTARARGIRSQPSPLVLPPPFLCCSVEPPHLAPSSSGSEVTRGAAPRSRDRSCPRRENRGRGALLDFSLLGGEGGGVGRRAQAGARRRTCPERGAPWLRINRGRAAWRVRAAAEGLTGMCTACGPRSVTSPARNAPRPPVCAACHSGSGR